MDHTWQSEFLPKLEIVNAAAGDVLVCGLHAKPEQIAPELQTDRVGFVAPLRTRTDLEWLMRGLHLHPRIRHLVLCGDDLTSTGQALHDLWEQGLDAGARMPGERGLLAPELDADAIDWLRRDVTLHDWREKTLAEVSSGIRDLPQLAQEREPRSFPDVQIPRRKNFLSRKTSFPIFTGDVADGWLQLLNLVIHIGTEKKTAEGDHFAEALNAVVTVELPDTEGELPAWLDFNGVDFDRYYRRVMSPSAGESQLGGSHYQRLREFGGVDQLEALSDRLKKSLDTRSGTLVVLDPQDLGVPGQAPALVSATFNVVDEKLFGSFVLRSLDVYTDWPLEGLCLARLQREVAERLGLDVGTATFVIHSAHLYERDWDRAQRALKESFERPLPLQVDPSGIFLFGNDGGEARAMLLDHNASTIFWEDAFSDPEDLSWYIVDVMPWLLPQHIRYVGQECASLMRAIREGECYEQG